jgi:hypothetical protein
MELLPRPWIDPAGTSGLVAATSPAPSARVLRLDGSAGSFGMKKRWDRHQYDLGIELIDQLLAW